MTAKETLLIFLFVFERRKYPGELQKAGIYLDLRLQTCNKSSPQKTIKHGPLRSHKEMSVIEGEPCY